MKNKYVKRALLLLMVLCMASATGCGKGKKNGEEYVVKKMEKEDSKAVSFDFIGGKDVMPIGGYYGPYNSNYSKDGHKFPDYVTDEYMQLIAESGINMITYINLDYAAFPERVKKCLDLGEKYGVGIFVKDTTITSMSDNDSLNVNLIEEQLAKYYDHPACCGLYLIDEPDAPYYTRGTGKRMISMYGDLANALQYDLDVLCYSNMLPVTSMERDKENYERYVEEFCDTFKPKVIMWDYYILDAYGTEQAYFWNMDLMRQQSQKNGVPFWAFIQAGGRWRSDDKYLNADTYHPTEGEFNWNVNTSLAFGAQGIQYFPLIQPDYFAFISTEDGDFEASGIVGALGNKTLWYGYAQNINKHIRVIDEVLMNSVHKGLIVSGEKTKEDVSLTSCVIESGRFQELVSVSGDAMVGCFNYNGKTALYVVNYSTEYAQNITLNFNDACNIKITQNAEDSYVNAETLTLDMAAGEGAMLVIE